MGELAAGLYFSALSDLTLMQVRTGVERVIRERKTATMPKPAEIREAVIGNPEDRAQLAAALVYEAIHKVGAYQSVQFADKIAQLVVERLGGWVKLCVELEWEWAKKDFVKLYEAAVRAGWTSEAHHLPGILEAADGQWELCVIGERGDVKRIAAPKIEALHE